MEIASISYSVVTALIALGGVIIGGVLTAGGNFFLERRREIRAAAAARSVFLQEVEDALKTVREGLRENRWPLGWKPWPQTWEAYRAAAASRWSSSDFGAVAKAYADMYGLDHGLRDGHGGDRTFHGDDEKFFQDACKDLEQARLVLAADQDPSQ
jgi:hypothetical protein